MDSLHHPHSLRDTASNRTTLHCRFFNEIHDNHLRSRSQRGLNLANRVGKARSMLNLLDRLSRRIALRWLFQQQERNRGAYPSLCCYSRDWITVFLVADGQYEKPELDFILDRFEPFIRGRTVLDVGANIGNHAVAFAGLADRVVAFEPHPVTSQMLRLNSRLAKNIDVHDFGASDCTGTFEATVPIGNVAGAGIDRTGDGEKATFSVQPIDGLPGLTNVGLVKIDVEGHEERAIRGMAGLLSEQKPLILFEQNEDVIKGGTTASIELLRSLGYAHFYALEAPDGGRMALQPFNKLERRSYTCLVASVAELT